jgi:hypothetical protein
MALSLQEAVGRDKARGESRTATTNRNRRADGIWPSARPSLSDARRALAAGRAVANRFTRADLIAEYVVEVYVGVGHGIEDRKDISCSPGATDWAGRGGAKEINAGEARPES